MCALVADVGPRWEAHLEGLETGFTLDARIIPHELGLGEGNLEP